MTFIPRSRPSFDKIYTDLARSLSERSTCARLHVGCVITSVDNQRVLAIGYNGSWRGGPNGCDTTEPGACGCIHAEQNAMIKLDYNDPCEKRLYTTVSPCTTCAKFIINAGISEVVYLEEYRTPKGLEVLTAAGIPFRKFEQENYDELIEELKRDGELDFPFIPWSKEKEVTDSWRTRIEQDRDGGGVRIELRTEEVQGSGPVAPREDMDSKPRHCDPVQAREAPSSILSRLADRVFRRKKSP